MMKLTHLFVDTSNHLIKATEVLLVEFENQAGHIVGVGATYDFSFQWEGGIYLPLCNNVYELVV